VQVGQTFGVSWRCGADVDAHVTPGSLASGARKYNGRGV
jgi:hypothetical protein